MFTYLRTVSDHLVATMAKKPNLKFMGETMATKILTCRTLTGKVQAYGVNTVKGAYLAGSAYFKGKAKLTETPIKAKYEVIIAGGTMQSPQLLMVGIRNALVKELSAEAIAIALGYRRLNEAQEIVYHSCCQSPRCWSESPRSVRLELANPHVSMLIPLL